MNFDYTYIILGGAIIFEPMTILTNLFIGIFCTYAVLKTLRSKLAYERLWGLFLLTIGLGSTIGSVGHGVHFQLGDTFLRTTVFLMNAVSLLGVYFCFKAAFTYHYGQKEPKKIIDYIAIIWIIILLVFTFFQGNFLPVKIHAGIALSYALVVHLIKHRQKQAGCGYVAGGILISFLSIVVHSLKFSFSEWFNYKDISHVIVLIALIFIYKGVRIVSKNLAG